MSNSTNSDLSINDKCLATSTLFGGTTLYAIFGIGHYDASGWSTDNHYPLPFTSIAMGSSGTQDNLTFGTSTDPATSLTTADATATDAALLVPMMWYVPDNISIDAVTSLEANVDPDTRTTRMHLYEYTFTSGSTSALTSGRLLAHNSDVTNAGSEQAYLSTWTVDSSKVTAGKVVLAFFRWDSGDGNDEFSVSVTVKYHLI